MKQISIIIPINKNVVATPQSSVTKITDAFSPVYHDLLTYGIECEIILVADSLTMITLQDIEIYPQSTRLKFYKEKNAKNISDLVIKGIAHAHYDYIGILGSTTGYAPGTFKKILADIEGNNDIVATVRTNASSFLPFFFKMRINPHHATLFFPKNAWGIIKFKPTNDAVFLLEFLKRVQEAGFSFKKYQLPAYTTRLLSHSQLTIKELVSAAKDVFLLFIRKVAPIYIPAKDTSSMVNAGLFYKKRKYITHTTLNIKNSALEAFDKQVIFTILILFSFLVIMIFFNPLFFIQVFIALLSMIYLIDVCFNMFLVFKTFQDKPELSFPQEELVSLKNKKLPIYSILCPLYKEAHILPQFIKGLEKLDWPKDKLDVVILLESDDKESMEAFNTMDTPSYMRAVIVPNSIPKTKPKACNYGLSFVKGEYVVIYDAEDIPDPLQLKKAYLGFKKSGAKVACLQAKLNYYNANQNLLTRFFTAEYSLWFDITLTSLHALRTIIPLGGTSNHFRTKDLKKLHAWDPFNVTEDADLGLRLFKLGYHTAILDSVTLEEGNSEIKNWIRQRSRWIKGYMQTYLVHTKETFSFFKERGVHALIFHLVIGGKLAFIIINPFLWIVTILYFFLYAMVGSTIDSLYPPFVLYVAMTSLIFGNYLYFFCHLMGCVKKNQWELIKYVFFIPLYWLLISVAGFLALYQLVFKPFYWEKTVHGLHLKNKLTLSNNLSNTPAPAIQN